MRTHGKRGFRPRLEGIESRCLLSAAVLEIQNHSTYDITFNFRWAPSSAWSTYSEAPGQGEILWTGYSSSLTPQVLVNTTTHAGSETTYSLLQGYGEWNGSGTPPASAAALYEFQNTTTGIGLSHVSPALTAMYAVVAVRNSSSSSPTFGFRWTSSSPWTLYTEAPGQYRTFWTTYSSGLSPQVLYDTSSSPKSQVDCSLSQGYNQWTGTGTPPASAATPYAFENTSTGIQLRYAAGSPGPAPNAVIKGNWSGYVAATNISSPRENSVSAVYGSWIVPTVTGPSSGTTDSCVWVGIDGFNNSTVEQLGTAENVVNGRPQYFAWWEMYSSGKGQPQQPITKMTVMPGDSITASVQYISSGAHKGQFHLSIVNNSRANDSFDTYETSSLTQNPRAQRSSAEWIVEAPTNAGGHIATLANFGQVTFTNAAAVISGVKGPINSSSWQLQADNIGSIGVIYDTTSALTNSGTSFVVTYNAFARAAARTSTSAGRGRHGIRPRRWNNPSVGQVVAGPVIRGSISTGASVVPGFRTPIRKHARPEQGSLIDLLSK